MKLKIFGENREKLLENILYKFFNKTIVEEFRLKFLTKRTLGEKNLGESVSDKEQIKIEINNYFKITSQIDLIITFAENNLPSGKFLELLSQLGRFSITTTEFSSAVYIYEKIIGLSKGNKNLDKISAESLLALGEIFSKQALWGISFNYIKEANLIFKRLNNIKGLINCENLLGTIYGETGNLDKSKVHFEKALLLLKKKFEANLKGKIEINLGIINTIQGNFESALKNYKNALNNFNPIKDARRVAEIRHNIGMLYSKSNKYNLALREFNSSIKLSMKNGDLQTLGFSYLSKAFIYAVQKEYNLGEAFADKALEVCHKTNDRLSIADIYKIKGIIQRGSKKYSLAENYLHTSLRINKELKNELNKAETEIELGVLYSHMNKKGESRNYFNNAKHYYSKIGAMQELKQIENYLTGI
ncbi:MAG: tetratricopeptide repeat protein [Bacteroidetes bacterium]|nr:tetratricopeptide repeat protein [Bacteroidota bacterium]